MLIQVLNTSLVTIVSMKQQQIIRDESGQFPDPIIGSLSLNTRLSLVDNVHSVTP